MIQYPHHQRLSRFTKPILFVLSVNLVLWANHAYAQGMNLARYAPVTANFESGDHPARYANDGMVSPISRWVSELAPHWLEVELPGRLEIGSAHVYTGNHGENAIASFTLEYQTSDGWVAIPGAQVTDNTKTQLRIQFTEPVVTDRVRLISQDAEPVSVAELAVFASNGGHGFPIGETVDVEVGLVPFVTASSQLDGKTRPFLATDGIVDGASQWSSASGEGPHWLRVQFQSERSVAYAHVYTGSGDDVIAKFHLECLGEDGETWQKIPGAEVAGNTEDTVLLAFDTIRTTGVRLVVEGEGAAVVRELVLLPPNNGDGYPAGTEVTIAPPAQTQFATYGDSLYQLKHSASGLAIGTIDGRLVLSAFDGGEAQQYHLLNLTGTDTYRIVSRGTNKCLQVAGGSKEAGSAIEEGKYYALDYQLWTLGGSADGVKQLVNVHSGLALGVDESGKVLVQQPVSDTAAQRWEVVYYTHYPKKGLAEIGSGEYIDGQRVHHIYNWGLVPSGGTPERLHHAPMIWGNRFWEEMALRQAEWYATAEPEYLMGFNEPDHTDQSNISPALALELYSAQEAIRLPLVSPCSSWWNNGWSMRWFNGAKARGMRFEKTAIHVYIGQTDPDSYMGICKGSYDLFGKPLWITEWNVVNWGGPARWTDGQMYSWMAEVVHRMEKADYIERYHFFPFSVDWENGKPGAPWESDRLTLRPLGRLYGAWDSDTEVRTSTWYYLHHKGSHDRLRVADYGVSMTPIDDIHPDTNWYLTEAGDGKFYITSRHDDQRLSVDGGTLTLMPAGASGEAVEWAFMHHQHGWYFIEHVASGKRLSFGNADAGVTLAGSDVSGAAAQWRVIKPYLPGAQIGKPDTIAPAAPFLLKTQEADRMVRVEWKSVGPESDFDHYRVFRSESSGGPYELVAENVKKPIYTDSKVENSRRYHYVVQSVDMAGNTSGYSDEGSGVPANWVKLDDRDERLTYSGEWGTYGAGMAYGGTESFSELPDSEVSLTFTGKRVRYFGYKREDLGIVDILIDGEVVAEVDCYADQTMQNVLLFDSEAIPEGEHTITVRITGNKSPSASGIEAIVDAIEYLTDASDTAAPGVPSGLVIDTDLDRIELKWNANSDIDFAGYTVYRADIPGGEYVAIAEDIAVNEFVDTDVKVGQSYSYAVTSRDFLGNVSARSAELVGSPGKWIKIDDADDRVVYQGEWGTYTQNPSYKNTEHFSEAAGAEASFTFTGSQVRFFGFQRNDLGQAEILIDGKTVYTADCFSDYEAMDKLVYQSEELAHGKHTITVRALGKQNPLSSGNEIIIDAFEFKTTQSE